MNDVLLENNYANILSTIYLSKESYQIINIHMQKINFIGNVASGLTSFAVEYYGLNNVDMSTRISCRQCLFKNNLAITSAAGYSVIGDFISSCYHCVFASNYAKLSGAAIYIKHGQLHLTSSEIKYNKSPLGGNVLIDTSQLFLYHSIFNQNTANKGSGAAVFIDNIHNVIINKLSTTDYHYLIEIANCTFINNIGRDYGCIYMPITDNTYFQSTEVRRLYSSSFSRHLLSINNTNNTSFPVIMPTMPPNNAPSTQFYTNHPTQTPTYFRQCGINKFCKNVDVFPSASTDTVWSISIQNSNENIDTQFEISFIIHQYDCMYPTISVVYEIIDYNDANEYLEVYDNRWSLIKRCNDGQLLCGQYATCLSNHQLDVAKIHLGNTYQITILESHGVDPLCDPHSTNANLTLYCNIASMNPSLSPTLVPTINPTASTLYPTVLPSNLCSSWQCYFLKMYPMNDSTTANSVTIMNSNQNIDTYFYIFVTSENDSCIHPMLSFSFERIDTDSSGEYIDVFDVDGLLIARCGAGSVSNLCNNYNLCVDGYYLGIDEIATNETYVIKIMESRTVDALCNHPYSTNAILTIKCLGPTTTASPSNAPTSWTPAHFSACGANTFCGDILVFPNISIDTKWTIPIRNINHVTDVKFNVSFYIKNNDCKYPAISFVYEIIDYNSLDEYLEIIDNNNSVITRCVLAGQQLCGQYAECLSKHQLGPDKISAGESYQITILESKNVNSLCPHQYSTNATLSLQCFAESQAPSTSPTTTSPTFASGPCADNTYCSYLEVFPNPNNDTKWSVSLQGDTGISGSWLHDTKFNISFIIHTNNCAYPLISFTYEMIDYDNENEYLDVFDHNDSLIARCGNIEKNMCGQYAHCLLNHQLGPKTIDVGNIYQITIIESWRVDPSCSHQYSINANLTLHCLSTSLSPSVSPTTYKPTMGTENPTPRPTDFYLCGIDRYTFCANLQAFPNETHDTQWPLLIQNTNKNTRIKFNISFEVNNNVCTYPEISFIYEMTHYFTGVNGAFYSVYDNDEWVDRCIARNIGETACGQYTSCLSHYPLKKTRISPGENYHMTIIQSDEVDALCNHPYSTNAIITLYCLTTPTPIVAPIGFSTCGRYTYCANVDVFPDPKHHTESFIVIKNRASYYYNVESTFIIAFNIKNNVCKYPVVSFIYEPIDSTLNQYLRVFDDDSSLLAYCDDDYPCGEYKTCFTNYQLGTNRINAGNTYQMTITEANDISASCNHPYSTNATLIFGCLPSPNENITCDGIEIFIVADVHTEDILWSLQFDADIDTIINETCIYRCIVKIPSSVLCATFTIHDRFGDGLNYGEGNYAIKWNGLEWQSPSHG
eukprot:458936_1